MIGSVQRNREQQHGWLQRFEVVPLRRQGDQTTRSKLGLRVTGAEQDTSLQAEHRCVPGTLVLTHHLTRPECHQRLP